MSDVKRIWLAWEKRTPERDGPNCRASEWRNDLFVLAEHYDALEAEAQALREEVAQLKQFNVTLNEENTRLFADWEKADQEVAALSLELEGCENVKEQLAAIFRCADEPRWKWIVLHARQDAEELAALRSKLKLAEADAYDIGVRYDALRDENEALRARMVVPDGYVLVPLEPTREMFIAVNKEDDKAYAGGCYHGAQFDWLWDAALEAAPRLNGKAVSEGLLRRLLDTDGIDGKFDAQEHYAARQELKALLGEGK